MATRQHRSPSERGQTSHLLWDPHPNMLLTASASMLPGQVGGEDRGQAVSGFSPALSTKAVWQFLSEATFPVLCLLLS